MIQQFNKFISENHLFDKTDTLLVGVSGGIDSVVLLDLLDKGGYNFVIAHCNFQLRGEESDGDERLVVELARKYDMPLYKTTFDTADYAQEKKISIEMAARDLRYQWFEEMRVTHHCDSIAVAHHRDDQIETFFLNLARGTGLNGLTGMKPINGKVVRPLLFASRKEIEKYRHENYLDFREDRSNSSLDYQRNKIRHTLLPVMETLNPSFREGLVKTMGYLDDSLKIFNQSIQQNWERVAQRSGRDYLISIPELKLLDPLATYLFEFLKPFGFNSDVVDDIILGLNGISGKQFLSATHRLVRDRESLILTPLLSENQRQFYLDENVEKMTHPVSLKISVVQNDDHFKMSKSPLIAYIDHDRIHFPLLIRKWQSGDYFKPLGMSGLKKVSDFFIDMKFSLPEKQNSWILANGEQLVWIIGHRLDDRFKITSDTKVILKIECVK